MPHQSNDSFEARSSYKVSWWKIVCRPLRRWASGKETKLSVYCTLNFHGDEVFKAYLDPEDARAMGQALLDGAERVERILSCPKGWVALKEGQSAHYFEAGAHEAICGRGGRTGGDHEKDGAKHCGLCMKKIAKEKKQNAQITN